MSSSPRPTFFASAALFREWLSRHHASATEIVVGIHKVDSGLPSVNYVEALDEVLCFGWIDGIRRSLNSTTYTVRFTPRKKNSYWSWVNIQKAKALIAAGRMTAAGLEAFKKHEPDKAIRYSDERKSAAFTATHIREFKAAKAAWDFFSTQAPSYQRTATWWVESAKQPETRDRRLKRLIADSQQRRRVLESPSAASKRAATENPVSRSAKKT